MNITKKLKFFSDLMYQRSLILTINKPTRMANAEIFPTLVGLFTVGIKLR